MQIRISLEVIRSAAARHQEVQSTVNEASERIEMMLSRLNDAWDGGASQQALGQLQELRDSINEIGEGTGRNANWLDSIANAFEQLDAGVPLAVSRWMDTRLLKTIALEEMLLRLVGNLRIIPDEVREVADEGRHVSAMLKEAAHNLRAQLDELANSWEGRSYNRFADESRMLIDSFEGVSEQMENYARRLNIAADRYEELDNSL